MATQPIKVISHKEDFIVTSTSTSIDPDEFNVFCSAGEIIEVIRVTREMDEEEFRDFCEEHEYGMLEELSRY